MLAEGFLAAFYVTCSVAFDFALGFAKDVGVELKGTETIRQIIRDGLRSR